jgi:biopolymer transport protein ExbD
MNMRPTKHDDPEINLTPLIDVVFLLLTFFMVTTSFIHESELKINLPEAAPRPIEPAETPIQVSIDQEGRIAVNGQRLSDNRLPPLIAAMKAAAGNRKQPQVIISADAKTQYQSVVTAMDAAQQLGFTRLSLATEERPSSP